jgi:hypothetical protein
MSTELFRKYIDILKEGSEEVVVPTISEITRLKIALQELEAVLSNYEGRINEATTPPPVPPTPPPTPPSSPSYLSRLLSSPAVQDAAAIAKTSFRKNKRSATRGAWQATAAAVTFEILTGLYDWFTSKKLDSLRPGDQEIIKKNIPIILPYTAPDKLRTLDPDLKFRLLHVVELLEKLGMSLGAPPPVQNEDIDPESEPVEAPESQADREFLNLLDRAYDQIDESDQMAMKRFVLQNMHLLSEAEQMAVRRDMLSEIDWDTAAQLAGAGVAGAAFMKAPGWIAGGYQAAKDKMTKQARKEAEIEAAKKAAGTAADEATAAIDAANQENIRITAQNNADELAVNQENARITRQNAEAERRWRASPASTRGPRPTPTDLKPPPTPKPLVPVPEMPLALKSPRRGPTDRLAAATGRLGMANPKTAKLIAGALALTGMAVSAYYYYKLSVETGKETINIANDYVQKEVQEIKIKEELFKRASQMTDEELAELLLKNPEEYLKYAKVVMEFCSGHPNNPKCQKDLAKLCADQTLTALNGGPLAGCRAVQATANQ